VLNSLDTVLGVSPVSVLISPTPRTVFSALKQFKIVMALSTELIFMMMLPAAVKEIPLKIYFADRLIAIFFAYNAN
jgi:hypothetical protein